MEACQNESSETPYCNRERMSKRRQKCSVAIQTGLICIVGVCSAEGQSASKSGIVAADLGVIQGDPFSV